MRLLLALPAPFGVDRSRFSISPPNKVNERAMTLVELFAGDVEELQKRKARMLEINERKALAEKTTSEPSQ
jgi:hypothetical protein